MHMFVAAIRAFRGIVDLALPPRCPGCGAIVAQDGEFCVTCWTALEFLPPVGCPSCNRPVATAGNICGPCLEAPPRHDGVRAPLAYGNIAANVALRLKYGRRTGLARAMAARIVPLVQPGAILVPVPLHRWRLWSRGFNQSKLIADAIARATGLRVEAELLIRARATVSLRGLSGRARSDAVRGAFRMTGRVDGATICLVDDVYASGATANACAAVLKRAGATRVIILCWARVVRDD